MCRNGKDMWSNDHWSRKYLVTSVLGTVLLWGLMFRVKFPVLLNKLRMVFVKPDYK